MKRKFIIAAVSLLIAPLLTILLPAGTASAHGWITGPASRQGQCATGAVSCGEIKYEPQSVEGPKGLRNCHGNVSRFAELNNDNKGWKRTNVGRTVTFNWNLTVQHRTANWEYYVGGTRVGVVNGNNSIPPKNFSHTINVGTSGSVKLLAIWNIGDTGNAFYNCVDLQVS